MTRARLRYLVNPGFQIRWSIFIALLGALTATIFGALLWAAIDNQNQLIEESIATDARLYDISEDVAILLLNLPETTQEESQTIGSRFDEAAARFESVRRHKRQLQAANEGTKAYIVVAIALITLVLFLVGILITHSIAGPIRVVQQQLESYRVQRRIDPRQLRRRDEFQDVYDTLKKALGDSELPPALESDVPAQGAEAQSSNDPEDSEDA